MRLIDADILTDGKGVFSDVIHVDFEKGGGYIMVEDLLDILDKQPTVYDVDKVEKLLQTLKQNEIELLCKHESYTKDMQAIRGHNVLQDAIKVVKSGGIEKFAGEEADIK